MTDLIDEINTMCGVNSWICAFGLDAFEKNIATSQSYAAGTIVLAFEAYYTPTIKNTKTINESWRVVASLGRKFDPTYTATDYQTSTASLDETHQQKYDRRLYELATLLVSNFAALACTLDLDLAVGEIGFDVNMFDTNIDFVTSQLTFTK
jgi:hypothetical protein